MDDQFSSVPPWPGHVPSHDAPFCRCAADQHRWGPWFTESLGDTWLHRRARTCFCACAAGDVHVTPCTTRVAAAHLVET